MHFFSRKTVTSSLGLRAASRGGGRTSLALSLTAISVAFNPLNAAGQEFFDCPSVPGEYIVKYKEQISSFSGSPVAVLEESKQLVHKELAATNIKEPTEVSTRLESFKTSKGKDDVIALLKDPKFAERVEYIQANCIYKPFEYRVSGTLRDPAAKRPQYPLTVNAAAADRSDWSTFGLAASLPSELQSWDLQIPFGLSDGRQFPAPFLGSSSFQAHFNSEDRGLADILSFGTGYLPDEKEENLVPIPLLLTQRNKGNGTYKMKQVLPLGAFGQSALTVARKGYLNGDWQNDFAAAIAKSDGSSELVLLLSAENGFAEKKIPLPERVTEMVLADVNGDDKTEIVVQGITGEGAAAKASVSFLGRTADGNFKQVGEVALPSAAYDGGFRIVEINNDAHRDIIAISGSSIAIARGEGNFTFDSFEEISLTKLFGPNTELSLREVDSADLDQNGSADAVLTCTYKGSPTSNPQSVFVLLFSEGGTITRAMGRILGDAPAQGYEDLVTLHDVTGDARVDLIYSLGQGEYFKVFANKASTDAQTPITLELLQDFSFPLGGSPYRAAAVDPFAIVDAPVLLTSAAGKKYLTFTDDQGNFDFGNIPAGVYTPEVYVEGYFFPTFSGKPLNINKNTTGLVHFGKRKPYSPPDSPATKAPNTPNDYGFNLLWGLHNYGQLGGVANVDVDAPEAWSTTRGKGVVVAVFDSGVDVNHPEFAATRWVNPGEIPGNNTDDDKNGVVDDAYGFDAGRKLGDPIDTDFHGTHVAGTIAAAGNNVDGVIGVSPEAKVLGVRVVDANDNFTAAGILNGANYVLWAKKQGHNIRVVNASFGATSQCQPFEKEYIQALNQAGILFVAAAGNDASNNDSTSVSPANCDVPNVIAVAAVNNTGNLASFSNYGASKVHVAAPGEDIWSLTPEKGYQTLDGTSMAAPHVAGVAALLFSARPELSPEQAKQRLIQTSKPLSSLTGKVVSGGVVSAAKAIAGDSSGGGGNGGGNGGGSGGSNGGGSNGGGGSGTGSSGAGVSYKVSSVVPKKTTPVRVTFSQSLTPSSLGCFSSAVSPKKKGQTVRATLSGSQLSLQLVAKQGKKTKAMPWPAKGSLAIRIAGNCASGVSGALVDTDANGQAGGPGVVINVSIGGAKKKK
jgi:subtilisin family serine protease